MHIKSYIVAFLLQACASVIAQQPPASPVKDVPAFKAKLEAMSQNVNTIESDFVQEKNLSVLANTIVSKGHFIFKKENNIRWEYLQPYKYLIIISNNKIFVKEEQNQKQYDIQSNKMFQEMNKFISGCIQGDILKNDKDFAIGYFEDDRSFFVSLKPKAEAMRKMLNEVQIWFAKSDLTVTRIRMIESGGDYTKIDFTNKKINTEVPVEKFSFK
ncbi:MAG TPA: outer membrane lipoprotein carrier protein LolA [Bacteroidales bacterium]|nr:outer membrane lipoprotein carrier protein LolA [Bacteroidales bacterium]